MACLYLDFKLSNFIKPESKPSEEREDVVWVHNYIYFHKTLN